MTVDTSPTVKLRWETNVTHYFEAEIPVDQMPERLIEEDGDEWSIRDGEFDQHEVLEFFQALEDAGSAEEQSLKLNNVYVLEEEAVPAVMVAAAPIPAVTDTTYIGNFGELGDSDFWACEQTGEHVKATRHRWQDCPNYNGEGD